MNNIVTDVLKIKYNALTLAPAMVAFYEECKVERDNLLLLYLVFPVIINPDWLSRLPKVQSNSRLETWARKNLLYLEGLPDRFVTFKQLSEHTFQYCIDMGYLTITDNNNVLVIKNIEDQNKTLISKSASRLAKLFSTNTVLKIYSILGIREIL